MQIRSVWIPQVYMGVHDDHIENEMVNKSNECATLLAQGFKLNSTLTATVGHVGYIVYVLTKED